MADRPVAIVGASETTDLGEIRDISNVGLHADAAVNALADAGLGPSDIDGLASGYEDPPDVAAYLGIEPQWMDGTSVGGCSWLILVRHAVAAIRAGHCSTVLVTHGESGRSRVGGPHYQFSPPGSQSEQFELVYGQSSAISLIGIPVLRYMREFGVTEEQLANVAVVQREWAALNPRALMKEPITIEEVLASPMIAYPFRRAMCCLVTDGGGALVLTSADRAQDLPRPPVYVLGTGEASDSRLMGIAEIPDLIRPRSPRRSGRLAFEEAGIVHDDVDHLMIYDAFVHNPLYGLEALGFVDDGEAADFVWERRTAIGGELPMNTNGGGLSYTHSGSYGMYLMQESVRQLRGEAPAQVEGARIGVCHGWGGVLSTCATLVLGNELP